MYHSYCCILYTKFHSGKFHKGSLYHNFRHIVATGSHPGFGMIHRKIQMNKYCKGTHRVNILALFYIDLRGIQNQVSIGHYHSYIALNYRSYHRLHLIATLVYSYLRIMPHIFLILAQIHQGNCLSRLIGIRIVRQCI